MVGTDVLSSGYEFTQDEVGIWFYRSMEKNSCSTRAGESAAETNANTDPAKPSRGKSASGYRPISDLWFLTRAKLKGGRKYYGAYLGGFPERARVLIGCSLNQPVLHVCGGMAKYYPYAGGFGPNDKTLDLDPATEPDYLQNALDPLPGEWPGVLIDPPYSEEDAAKYAVGAVVYPPPGNLVENALRCVPVGAKVGILHYSVPRCPQHAKLVACVGVVCGFGNRIRCFSVFERLPRNAV